MTDLRLRDSLVTEGYMEEGPALTQDAMAMEEGPALAQDAIAMAEEGHLASDDNTGAALAPSMEHADGIALAQSSDNTNIEPSTAVNFLVTPTRRSSSHLIRSSFIPEVEASLKPAVGMTFDTLADVEKFYKDYAHDHAGFSVRIGQHRKEDKEILTKYFYCSREGYRKNNDKKDDDQSGLKGKKRKTRNVMETRCGCQAHIYVTRGPDKKYKIASMVEQHNHGVVSPNHRHLLRSNRHVTDRVKAFLANEKIDSYVWLFKTFLEAMGGRAPHLIVTDECASMKAAIGQILPETTHRLCMWHIMEKVHENISPSLRADEDFWNKLHTCVWDSETIEEFESRWNSMIVEFQLVGNKWFGTRFLIRESWIPVYFIDIPLAGILRTTSRSESANSFFNRFIHQKLSFVEFWLRFDTALEYQRQEELKQDHKSLHTTPKLMTPWAMEKQCSMIYTHEIFDKFQKQIVASRDHCFIQGIIERDEIKLVTIGSTSKKERLVHFNKSGMIGRCTCKLFESHGIPC
ncbi:protein FAR1-RELATED SEQUENCE 5-like isoform X4 [Panicum hallii]|uniref:protein FAR1-RELATED SEQUENCE 5-like isoform X4 n=1 Tax=Panicum hallii TaxID=206008 RepID=UPI000DF4E7F6|nr:protein FAR1-RELATED SEQUENCE 5-like isoform X4 [Panicum hallii]